MQPSGMTRRGSGRFFRRGSSSNSIDNGSSSSDNNNTTRLSSTGSSFRRSKSKSTAAVTTAMADCEIFLSSSKLGRLLSDLPTRSSDWLSILKKSLTLWQSLDSVVSGSYQDGNNIHHYHHACSGGLENIDHSSLKDVDKSMWETTCLVLKGAYYAQEQMDLDRLRREEWNDYALHAAVGLTGLKPGLLSCMIERLIQNHPLELQKADPITGRLPLHVVAATKYRPERLPMLETLLAVHPKAAGMPTALPRAHSCTTVHHDDKNSDNNSKSSSHGRLLMRQQQEKSDTAALSNSCCEGHHQSGGRAAVAGIYPLHLACQAGYPWKDACQDLYKAAPYIGTELTCPDCPAELRAIQAKNMLERNPSFETIYSVAQQQETSSPMTPYHHHDPSKDTNASSTSLSFRTVGKNRSNGSTRTSMTSSSSIGLDTEDDLTESYYSSHDSICFT